jgi:hypothetical protein
VMPHERSNVDRAFVVVVLFPLACSARKKQLYDRHEATSRCAVKRSAPLGVLEPYRRPVCKQPTGIADVVTLRCQV